LAALTIAAFDSAPAFACASSSSPLANLKLPHAVKVKIHNFTPVPGAVVSILPKEAIKMASQLRSARRR